MKKALITGASGEIGRAISIKLAQAGHHVILHAHQHKDRVEALADELNAQGLSASVCIFDVTDPVAVAESVAHMLATGPIQILVNNAGVYMDAPFAGMHREAWEHVIDVSLHGFYEITHALLLPMMVTRWGRIINISSVTPHIGNRGQANYAAAKAGLEAATRVLAKEVAARGVTVNAVAPGLIETDEMKLKFDAEFVKKNIPMQRFGTPSEVADLVAFLASDGATYISGQIILIDGAMV